MESERKKFYKRKVETICEQSQVKENTKKHVINSKKKVLQHSTKDSHRVTVLGSSSYHNQNKDFSIFNSGNDIPEDTSEYFTENEVNNSIFMYCFFFVDVSSTQSLT